MEKVVPAAIPLDFLSLLVYMTLLYSLLHLDHYSHRKGERR